MNLPVMEGNEKLIGYSLIELKIGLGDLNYIYIYLADPGKATGCSLSSLVINSLINSVSQHFPPTALRRRQAQTIRVITSS